MQYEAKQEAVNYLFKKRTDIERSLTANKHINTHSQPVERQKGLREHYLPMWHFSITSTHTSRGFMPDSHCAGPLNHSPNLGCAKHTHTHTNCWQP